MREAVTPVDQKDLEALDLQGRKQFVAPTDDDLDTVGRYSPFGAIAEEAVRLGAVEAQKQDLDGASKLADRACQGGDADGCTLLGDLFAKSNDVLRAGVAYAKACQAGAPAGCYGQGVLLVHSGADRDKGLKLLQKACNDGETRACEAARSPDL